VPRPLNRTALALAASVLVCLTGACQRKSSSATTTGTARNPAVARDTTTIDTTPAALTDANIMALLDEANRSDSATGAYALPKATSAEVKAFARLMMGEHHALRARGQQLARQLNLTPVAPEPDPLATAALSELAALQGATKMSGFDSTYIAQEIGMHRTVLDLADKAHDAADSPELKKLIEQVRPVIQRHLVRAQQIQKSAR
jgi:putative membrane protein